jgi:predicted secreted protein
MGPVSGLVLYLVLWFMTFLVALPIRIKTQGEAGTTVPGTHHGSPEIHHLKKKAWITTGVAFVLWVIIAAIILTGTITVRDLDWFGRMGPASS